MITVQEQWKAAFEGQARAEVEDLLPAFLMASRWFGGKAKTIRSARLADVLETNGRDGAMVLGLIDVSYREGGTETYTLPITAAFDNEADHIQRDHPQSVIGAVAVLEGGKKAVGILYDALWNANCASSLLLAMGRHAQCRGSSGTLVGSATELFDEAAIYASAGCSTVLKGEQSNTSVKFGDGVMMKLYRRVEHGMNPELEIGRMLTARHFSHSPSLIGALEYVQEQIEPMTLAVAQTFIANRGNAWDYTLMQLSHALHRTLTLTPNAGESKTGEQEGSNQESPASDLLLDYRDSAHVLGQRTGELHMALGKPSDMPAFAPEACSSSYVQSRVQAMQQAARQALALLRRRLPSLSTTDQEQAEQVLDQEPALLDRLGIFAQTPLSAMRIRCHGDYHLGQVLYTGSDFVIIDFEGEPARPLAERRTKSLPMVDLAGMIRSFHYAAHMALRTVQSHALDAPASSDVVPWVEQWYRAARTAFLKGYRSSTGAAKILPQSHQEFNLLLDVHILDKAFYELTYELNNRPDWVGLPLTGLLQPSDTSPDMDETDGAGTVKQAGVSGPLGKRETR